MSRWRPRSLTARILLAEAAAIAVAALLLPLLLRSVFEHTTRDYQDRLLFDQARTVAQGLAPDGRGSWRVVLPPFLRMAYSTDYDGRAFAVVDGSGTLRAGSRYSGVAPWRDSPRSPAARTFRTNTYSGVTVPVPAFGLWVIVTQDASGPGAIIDDIADTFQPRYSAVLLVVLLLLPLVNSLFIRRLVLSVRRASDEATAIGPDNLHVRLGLEGLPSEVQPLAAATNALLARLEAGFREQGQFVANVAHELRTPLATLRLRAGAVGDEAVRAGIERQVERLTHVISQLRDLGSIERGAPDRTSRFSLSSLAADVTRERMGDAVVSGRSIAVVAPDDPVNLHGNRALIEMALVNLLDNALRHTPKGTVIRVVVTEEPSITVEDDGPGLVGNGTDMAGTRFWRADHRRSDSAGLGLSIVRRIMEAHGGTLQIGQRQPNGAVMMLRFPQAAANPG